MVLPQPKISSFAVDGVEHGREAARLGIRELLDPPDRGSAGTRRSGVVSVIKGTCGFASPRIVLPPAPVVDLRRTEVEAIARSSAP
jgi:hypothetical protein